jgi:hypothetical protein
MADKVHPSPFRVPELIEMQLKVAEMTIRGHAYDCERARKEPKTGTMQDIESRTLTAERDSRVWDDVQALLNELRWGLDDMEARQSMPRRIKHLAERIASRIDE